ncbi:GH36 C-terminal domain-containing protein [Streptomyces sp. RB6PN25]|uniref:GH36 C-terminal domain-containing protein n=1 Tax=Streptomyces humicola TaxID=2953240 RepID=A0ABT1Q0R3_9ACTN|nr:GH36 C-terminal domain-containing protein [Streptomyces humicola]
MWQQVPRHGTPRPVLRLAGLDPDARYRDTRTGTVHHASVLTGHGIAPELPAGDWSSEVGRRCRVPHPAT